MKKTLAFALFASVVMTSCFNSNKYTISGKIDGIEDGDQVILVDMMTYEPIDSAYAQGGKYTMRGETQSEPAPFAIGFEVNGMLTTCSFFLEPGNLKVSYVNDNPKIGGSKLNKRYQQFYDEVFSLTQEAEEIDALAEYMSEEEYMESINEIEDKYILILSNSIEKNADNAFGMHQIIDNYMFFSPEEVMSFIEKLSPAYAENEIIVEIKNAIATQIQTAEGGQYLDFTAKRLDLNTYDTEAMTQAKLSDYISDNKVVLLDFWASWCAPCRGEIPGLKEIYGTYADKGLEIVSVSVDEEMSEWVDALKEEKMDWIQLIDEDMAPARLYGISSIPSTFLIDSTGKIIKRGIRSQELGEFLKTYLKD